MSQLNSTHVERSNSEMKSAYALGKAGLGLHHGVIESERDMWRVRNNKRPRITTFSKGKLHDEYD